MARHLTQIANRDFKSYNSEPDHQYIDFCMTNNRPDGQPVPLIFSDIRTQEVLNNPQDYYVTVCRFHIDTFSTIPAIIPQVQIGQSDPNLTVYSFTLTFEEHTAQVFLEFVPENRAEPTPKAPTTQQDMSSKYYFVSSYSYFVGLLNKTLTNAFNALAELVDLPTTHAPFLLYDSSTGSLIFNADAVAFDTENVSSPINIYCNNQMRNLLSSFEWLNYGFNASDGMNYMLNIYSQYGTNILELESYNVLNAYEEYNSIINWCPVQCISISSQSLPLFQTIISNPQDFNSITSMSVQSSNITIPTLTDFQVSLESGKEYVPSVDYTATHYRLIDLFGHTPIQNIQLYALWRDNYGNSYQIQLPCGSSANLKLLFRKKSTGPNDL